MHTIKYVKKFILDEYLFTIFLGIKPKKNTFKILNAVNIKDE